MRSKNVMLTPSLPAARGNAAHRRDENSSATPIKGVSHSSHKPSPSHAPDDGDDTAEAEAMYYESDDRTTPPPDSAIGDCCRTFFLPNGDDAEAFFREHIGRDDGTITREDVATMCQTLSWSIHAERELIEVLDRLETSKSDRDGDGGGVDLKLFLSASVNVLEMAAKGMRRETSPATLLLRQKTAASAASARRNGDGTLLFSFLSSNAEGLINVDALRDLWQNQLDDDDPDVDTTLVQTFLDSLSHETGGTVSALELAKNMERFLLEASDNSPATQTFRKLAIGAFKYEIDYLRGQAQNLVEERNKHRRDVARLTDQRDRLIKEAEEHKDLLHVQHQSLLETQRKAFEEQMRSLRNESLSESDLMAGEHQRQMEEIAELVAQLRQKESLLKEEITNLKYDNSNLEGELLDARAEMNTSKRAASRLRQELAAMAEPALPDDYDYPPSEDTSRNTTNFLREMNASLKDEIDELTAENESLKHQLNAQKRRRKGDPPPPPPPPSPVAGSRTSSAASTPSDDLPPMMNRRRKSSFGLQRRVTTATVEDAKRMASAVDEAKKMDVQRPSVIGAENDRPQNLMLETMVLPSEEEMEERREIRRKESVTVDAAKLTEELDAAKKQLARLETSERALADEVTLIKSTKNSLGEMITTFCHKTKGQFDVLAEGVQSRCSGFQNRLESLSSVLTKLAALIEAKQNRVVRSYEKEIAELEECLISVTEEHGAANDKLMAQCRQLEQQFASEKKKVEELTKSKPLVQLNDKSYAQLEKNRRLLRDKDAEIKRLKQDLNEKSLRSRDSDGKQKREVAQLKDAMLQLIVKQGEAEDEMKSKCALMEEEHARAVAEMQKKIDELKKEKDFMEESIKGSQAQMDEAYRRQTNELQEKVVQLKEERAFLEGESQARAEMEEHYRKAATELQSTIACLEEEKQMLENHVDDVEARWQKTASELRRRLDLMKGKHQREIETMRVEHESQRRETEIKVTHLQQTLDALTTEKDAGERRHREELSETNESWTNQLQQKVRSEKELFDKTAAEYRTQFDEAAAQNRQLKEVLWRLKKEKTDVEKSLNKRYEELEEDATRQATEMKATIDRLQKERQVLAEEVLERCRNLKEAFKTECRSMEKALGEVNEQNSKLREENARLEDSNRQKDEALHRWETKEAQKPKRVNLKSIEMRNSVRAKSTSSARESPPPPQSRRETTPTPLRVAFLVEEARKLKITVTDTATAAKNDETATTTIYRGENFSQRCRSRETSPEVTQKRIVKAERDVEEMSTEREDKGELLKRIGTVRKELSRLSAELSYNPTVDGKRAAEVLEQTNSALQAKVERLEKANGEWVAKLRDVMREKREAVEKRRVEESKATSMKIELQKLEREREFLKKRLDDLRRRQTSDDARTTTNATIKLKRPAPATKSKVRRKK